MKIAILGWGSLIWEPGELKTDGKWHLDGPFLPIEFARISQDHRLTLVLYPDANDIRTLWVYSSCIDLNQAIENLSQREGTTRRNIGFISIPTGESQSQIISHEIFNHIKEWAQEKGLGAVIWTDLRSKFKEYTGKDFNEDNVIGYLSSLEGERLNKAREYIEKAPEQIVTKVRRRIKTELGWR